MRVLHLAPLAAWRRASADGVYQGSTRAVDLTDVGYVHAATSEQLPLVVNGVYAGDPLDDHVLLVIDIPACEAAGSAVRWEVPNDADEPFPHVYGPIPVQAVVATLPVSRTADGIVVMPDFSEFNALAYAPGH